MTDAKPKKAAVMPEAGREGRPLDLRRISLTTAYTINENSAPLEYLFSKGMLATDRDDRAAAAYRNSSARRFRDIMEGAQISGLKSVDLEGASGGRSPGKLPGQHKMDCLWWLGAIRDKMPKTEMKLLEDVVFFDRWVWDEVRKDRREAVVLRIHKALDRLSLTFGMITPFAFNSRWSSVVKEQSEGEQGSPDPRPSRRLQP